MHMTLFQTGNGVIDDETATSGSYDFYWTHALISDEIHEGIVSNCNFSAETSTTEACNKYTGQADSSQGNIYTYNIYSQLCNSSAYFSLPVSSLAKLLIHSWQKENICTEYLYQF